MKTKEEYGELYYGKENLMGYENAKVAGSMYLETIHNEELLVETIKQIEVWGLDRNSAIDCQKALKEAKKVLKERGEVTPFPDGAEKAQYVVKDPYPWDKKGEVVKAMEEERGEVPMLSDAKVKKVKPKRFHVDLSPEQGESFTELAEKMGLTLNAVVKLFLMKPWKEYQYYGYDYIYLGVASKPMDEPSYKQ